MKIYNWTHIYYRWLVLQVWIIWKGVRIMVFNVSFNNISVISCRKSPTNSYHRLLYRVHLAWAGFKFTQLVVIGTECIGSYKSNYHTITTATMIYIIMCKDQMVNFQIINKMIFVHDQQYSYYSTIFKILVAMDVVNTKFFIFVKLIIRTLPYFSFIRTKK